MKEAGWLLPLRHSVLSQVFLCFINRAQLLGAWFETKDVLHHETIFVVLVALGIGIIVGFVIAREK